jgi:hypothetical protein
MNSIDNNTISKIIKNGTWIDNKYEYLGMTVGLDENDNLMVSHNNKYNDGYYLNNPINIAEEIYNLNIRELGELYLNLVEEIINRLSIGINIIYDESIKINTELIDLSLFNDSNELKKFYVAILDSNLYLIDSNNKNIRFIYSEEKYPGLNNITKRYYRKNCIEFKDKIKSGEFNKLNYVDEILSLNSYRYTKKLGYLIKYNKDLGMRMNNEISLSNNHIILVDK